MLGSLLLLWVERAGKKISELNTKTKQKQNPYLRESTLCSHWHWMSGTKSGTVPIQGAVQTRLQMAKTHGMLHTELLCSCLPGVVAYDCDLYTQKADLNTRTVSSSTA